MTKELKLKAGLEVHQQLDTGKLFCRCPSILHENDNADFVFSRFLRPVASELGEFDKASLEAFQRKQEFIYHGFNDCNCLVEMDEAPPMPVDKTALETILKVSLMCNSFIFNEIQAMRKTVIDGSNTSGFQRTMMIAQGGKIMLDSGKKIGVQSIVLEEDACRPIEKSRNKIIYNLDRLGIPLIELATDPDLETPEEVKQCALKIGELFRRTCKARRGLGTIRQDLNISIPEGARIELKGVQELQMIDEFVRREMNRQKKLIELKSIIKKRKIKKNKIKEKFIDLSQEFSKTNAGFVSTGLKKGLSLIGVKLNGFHSLLGFEVQPGRRFGTELSDYAKNKSKAKGIIHSDEKLEKYGFNKEEILIARKKLNCSEQDAFVLVLEEKEECTKALKGVLDRIEKSFEGVPNETRQALEGGNSSYLRPLGGGARMYPETDLSPIKIKKNFLNELKKKIPLTLKEREKLYSKKGLNQKLINKMKLNNWAEFYEYLLSKGFDSTFTAIVLLENLKQLERENIPIKNLEEKELLEFFKAEKKKVFPKDISLDILKLKAKNPNKNIEQLVKEIGLEKIDSTEIEQVLEKIVNKNIELIKQKKFGAIGALMGDAMKELKGKASGQEISTILKKLIDKKT